MDTTVCADGDRVLKRSHKKKIQFVCDCVRCSDGGERNQGGRSLLFSCCLVQVQWVKKPRRRVRGHQARGGGEGGLRAGVLPPDVQHED